MTILQPSALASDVLHLSEPWFYSYLLLYSAVQSYLMSEDSEFQVCTAVTEDTHQMSSVHTRGTDSSGASDDDLCNTSLNN